MRRQYNTTLGVITTGNIESLELKIERQEKNYDTKYLYHIDFNSN